jgi:glutaconate CoA-transferase subunit A
VIHQPYGAHPTTVFGRYDYDAAHLSSISSFKRAERIGDHIRDYIHDQRPSRYPRRSVGPRMQKLKADPALGY